MSENALNSRALPAGSRKNIVDCSPGCPAKRVWGSIMNFTPASLIRVASACHYLTAEEAGRLFKALDGSLNPQLKNIVALLLLTGARVSELLRAEWRHVDLERRAWLIETSKTDQPRRVPLSQAAIDIIEQLPRFDGCPYLVPNPETKLPFVTLKRAWQTARREARLGDLRIHDLRHSAASFMINAGIDLYAVGKVLGHADHKSTMRYSHLANETLLAAVEAGAAKMTLGASPQT